MSNLKKNLKTLEHHTGYISWLDSGENPEWLEVKEDKLLIYQRGHVKSAYPEGYLEEIQKFVDATNFYADSATVLVGMGLGHFAHKILNKMEKGHKLIVVEPLPAITKEAFKQYDFTESLRSGDLILVNTKEGIASCIETLDGTQVIQGWMNFSEMYVTWLPEYYEFVNFTQQILDQHRCGVGTVIGAGSTIAENDIKNFPFLVGQPGVQELKNIYKGKPIVSVTTGPGLLKNIHILKRYQDNVVIIAVAQALRTLLAHNITPDFITTVDYGEVNYEHFKGLMTCKIPLIVLNRSYYKIVEEYQGPKFVVGTPVPGFEDTIQNMIQDKGFLEQGGSVVHLSYQLAKHMGGDPIILIGHNLSYENNLSHVPSADANGEIEIGEDGLIKWIIKDPTSSLNKGNHSHGHVVNVPGSFGELVQTNIGLASFITTFEAMFQNDKDLHTIYNATEGGAYLKGSTNITLKKVLAQYGEKYLIKSVEHILANNFFHEINQDELFKKSLDKIYTETENFGKIIFHCGQAINSANKMVEAKKETILKRLEEENVYHAKKAREYAVKSPLMGLYIYKESRLIHSKELNVDGSHKNILANIDDRKTRVERSKLILEAAKNAAETLQKLYWQAAKVCKGKLKDKDALYGRETPYEISREDLEKYIKNGNWVVPYMYLRSSREYADLFFRVNQMAIDETRCALELERQEQRQKRLDYLYCIERAKELQKEGGEDWQKKSLRFLYKAEKIFPSKIQARWGIATTLALMGCEAKAISAYKNMLKDFPENLRMKFELSLVMLNMDTDQAIMEFKQLFKETNQFDYFCKNFALILYNQDHNNRTEALEYLDRYSREYPDDTSVDTLRQAMEHRSLAEGG